ncbi:hypothetical protein HDU97_000104 [Phlyctochytrium planicorne]|nr:hypothetical protein HDU97_000104 [Phlyctochytrium planicorne]
MHLAVIALTAALIGHAAAGAHEPDLNPKIKNVVLVCMENRSFDHMLGFWGRTRQGVDGFPDNAGNTCSQTGAFIAPKPKAAYISRGPYQNINATAESIYGKGVNVLDPGNAVPTMKGFCDAHSEKDVWDTTDPAELRKVIDGFTPEALPITTTLASEYAVFDRFFSSVPGPTIPNRSFLMSATSNGLFFNDIKEYIKGFPQKSIFGLLDDNKVKWKNYFAEYPSSIIFSDVRNIGDVAGKLRTFDTFLEDAQKGQLPSFSFIDPDYGDVPGGKSCDNHPPADVARGEAFLKKIYEAVRNSPQWESTMLIITYDEHGGFYDHVPPPVNVPSPDKISDDSTVLKFTRLGVRIPTIVVSPWIAKGTVVTRPRGPTPTSEFELSSVIATLRRLWNLSGSPLTRREAWAGTFEWIIDSLSSPRKDCPTTLPDPPAFSEPDPTLEDDVEAWIDTIKDVFKKIFKL